MDNFYTSEMIKYDYQAIKNMQPVCLFLIGLPGSGKTTFRDNFLRDISSNGCRNEWVTISPDSFIERYAENTQSTYSESFTEASIFANLHAMMVFEKAVDRMESVIIDRTNTNILSRSKYLPKITDSYKKVSVNIGAPYDRIIQVNEERKEIGRCVPDSVLNRMIDNYEPPSLDEGFDAVYKL